MLPQRIGRYDVSAELGRGATSIVYKGLDPASGRVVAIKTLKRADPDADGDADADADAILLRFRQEARTIGRLHHPGVVAVDEFGEDGLHSWIAMEFVEGSNLDEILLRTPLLGQDRCAALMDDLLDALGCVHREGICHRDVKPANIMVTSAGRVKLMDFGVARLRDLGLTRVSSIIGTPAFMAPEQFTGAALDHRADLFACGVLLFLLLSGRRPFSGAPAAVMHQILHEDPPLLSEAGAGLVGRAYDDVILRALAKRPELRFGSAEEMREALREAAQRAAESTRLTMEKTVVQDRASTPAADDNAAAAAFDERVLIQRTPHGHARLVDAMALYAPEVAASETAAQAFADVSHAHATNTALGEPALPTEVVAAAQRLLARRLGPVAGVLVKRAAEAAGGSRHAFVDQVVAALPASQQAGVRADLESLLRPPQRSELGR